jgi:hypothetical protein
MAVTDVHGGFIIGADVLAGTAPEQSVLLEMLQDIKSTFGEFPDAVLGDGVYPKGEILAGLEELEVELFSPVPDARTAPENPAMREDPTQPVAAEDRARLPINPQSKKLDKAAFAYVEAEDRYYCPQGQPLEYEETKSEMRRGEKISRRVYRSSTCGGCPLIAICQLASAQHGRSVSRDVHEPRRQAHAEKMATAESKARYQKRFHAAEVPFAILKHIMDLRRFLLRGIDNVRTEWLWGCTAYNLKKLMSGVARLRAQFAAMNEAGAE